MNSNSLAMLQSALNELRSGASSVQAFSQMGRQQDALLQALPAPFAPVWLSLLDRLESSALFSEESCSFSHSELLNSLNLWLDKAEQQLPHSD